MQKVTWYKRVLVEKEKEIVSSVALAALFALSVTLWHYFTGASLAWHSISPIEAPALLPRLFYSALVFVTIGALLYRLRFYKALYELYRGTRGGYRDYKEMKRVIWLLLILLMYFVIVPFVVDVLNGTISVFYNAFVLVLYISPALAITALLYGGYYAVKQQVRLDR